MRTLRCIRMYLVWLFKAVTITKGHFFSLEIFYFDMVFLITEHHLTALRILT